MLVTDTRFQDVFSMLSEGDRYKREVILNLSSCRFTDEDHYIMIYPSEHTDTPVYIVPKSEPKYPAQSLMKCLSLPHGFIMKNPADLNQQIIDEWKVRMKDPMVKVMYYTEPGSNDNIVRAVLPENYIGIKHSRLVEILGNLPNANTLYVYGISLDESFMELRVIIREPINLGTDENPDYFQAGLTVINSEVGCCPTEVHIGLFKLDNGSGFMLDYTRKPFFKWDSLKGQNPLNDEVLVRMFESALQRIDNDLPILIEAIRVSISDSVSTEYLAEKIKSFLLNRKIPIGFIKKINEEFELRPESFLTLFDLVKYMTEFSQTLPSVKRLVVERFAPVVLGVNMVIVDNQVTNVPENIVKTLTDI